MLHADVAGVGDVLAGWRADGWTGWDGWDGWMCALFTRVQLIRWLRLFGEGEREGGGCLPPGVLSRDLVTAARGWRPRGFAVAQAR